MAQVFADADLALVDVLGDGMTIAAGGFGLCGIPELLIAAVDRAGASDLTFYSNDDGTDDFGLGPISQRGGCGGRWHPVSAAIQLWRRP